MKKLIVVIIAFIMGQNAFAQWNSLSGPFFSDTLNKVYWVNDNNVFIIGQNNLIFKSTDGGNSWGSRNQSINPLIYGLNNFTEIKFLDSLRGFLASKYMFKTTDGGNNWFVSSMEQFEKYSFVSNNLVYGIKTVNSLKTLFVSNNGGINWKLIFAVPPLTTKFDFLDTITGFCINDNKLCRTDDQGYNWYYIYEVPGSRVIDFSFNDFLNGYLGASNKFLKTTDGGNSWIEIYNTGFDNWDFRIGLNKNLEVVTSGRGIIYYSSNAGITFTSFNTHISPGYTLPFAFKNIDIGIIGKNIGGLYLISDFNGTTENISSKSGIYENLKDLNVFDASNIIIAGDSNLIKTTNGGLTWSKFAGIKFNDIEFLNYETGYAINSNQIFKTTDHGTTWNILSNIPAAFNGSYADLKLKSDGAVFFTLHTYTSSGTFSNYTHTLYKTTNDGINWINIFYGEGAGSLSSQYDNYFPGYTFHDQAGYMLYNTYHSSGIEKCWIKKTTNNGNNWIDVFYKDSCFTEKLFFLNDNTGYFTLKGAFNNPQYNGIYKTTDGGINWEVVSSFTPTIFIFTNEYTAYSSGYCSSDGGYNWVHQFDPVSSKGLAFANNLTGYIIGDNGIVYKTTNGGGIILGVNQISSIASNNFSLSQNYPNPFNPSTKINYDIKTSGFVSLKVFDLLGKEVATLVNEKQNAGSYAVDFNSVKFNLPSGIYFYTLNAGEFKETKKMVLVK